MSQLNSYIHVIKLISMTKKEALKEEISKVLNENKRLNFRQKEITPGIINYYFDNIDTIDLDNEYKIKIIRTFYYRTPETIGYSEISNRNLLSRSE